MVRTFMSLAFMALLLKVAMAANYTVGGPNGGWDATTDLQTWAASHSFLVGDNLIFQYGPLHDVLEVSKAGYDSCQITSPLQSYSGGTTVIPLSSTSKRYFTCATPGHCAGGMKVEIDTLATSTPPPASPSTPPPASPSTPPPTSPSTPPPASPSLPSPPTSSTPTPASPVIPPVSSPHPEISYLSPMQSPEMSPTKSLPSPPTSPLASPASSPAVPPPIDGFLKSPLPSSADKDCLQSSLTTGISLVIMMVLLAL